MLLLVVYLSLALLTTSLEGILGTHRTNNVRATPISARVGRLNGRSSRSVEDEGDSPERDSYGLTIGPLIRIRHVPPKIVDDNLLKCGAGRQM